MERSFTIVYVDLVLAFTADILRNSVGKMGESEDFVGHIGGDDFILITQNANVDRLCQDIISRFDAGIKQFYVQQPGKRVRTDSVITDRFGNPVLTNGITISLSVLECSDAAHSEFSLEGIAEEAGHLKKKAKSVRRNTSVWGRLGQD